MIDPVSSMLEARVRERWPWLPAILAALLLHLAVAAGAILAREGHRRPLTLPSVRVRTAFAPPMAASPAPPAPAPARQQPPSRALPQESRTRPAPPKTAAGKAASPPRGRAATPATSTPAASRDGTAEARPGGRGSESGRAISVGTGAGDTTSFPYQYYFDRLLALIENNWYRPAAPAGTSCRVRCRIARSGRLLEAGIEVASGQPAYDRAALRAVYAGAPFPPLPEAFGGNELTVHLEFGP